MSSLAYQAGVAGVLTRVPRFRSGRPEFPAQCGGPFFSSLLCRAGLQPGSFLGRARRQSCHKWRKFSGFSRRGIPRRGRGGYPSLNLVADAELLHLGAAPLSSRKFGLLCRTNPSRPLHSSHLGCKIPSGPSKAWETSPLVVVSNQMSGPKAANQLVADRSSLIARVWARKAPRV